MRGLPPYSDYKDSGVEFLGDVPAHWSVQPAVTMARVLTSTVDKHAVAGEQAVQLCNYTDVYYNEEIKPGLEFMTATASREQIASYAVTAGDVVFTKDSETADDIGISAFVPMSLPGVVYGYHLSTYRPKDVRYGKFLKWMLDSRYAKATLQTRTLGVTRVGLSQNTVRYLRVPTPPPEEAAVIAKFLDRETAEIDAFIADQEQLIKLLAERRAATISHAVTSGLDPSAPTKQTDIAWLGEVPAHWRIGQIRRFLRGRDSERVPLSAEERSYRRGDFPYYGASGPIDSVDEYLFDEELVLVSEDGANLLARSKPIAFVAQGKYWVNNHAHILEPRTGSPRFWAHRIESTPVHPWVTGAAQPKLTADALMAIPVAAPPEDGECAEICVYLDAETAQLDAATTDAREAITLTKERRAALISAAVTGKIDVRGSV